MGITDTLNVLQFVFGQVWRFMTLVEVPGLGISFAAWTVAGLIISLVLAMIRYNFGVGGNDIGHRSGDSRTKHISENRKNDEK